jgi:uncharacterized damage-inducible protein DinB
MEKGEDSEVWLRGKLPAISDLLQPAAHALLQAREDVNMIMEDFPEDLLWKNLAGRASVGFHLQHLTGVLDRMLTYAEENELSEEQFFALNMEGDPQASKGSKVLTLAFDQEVDEAILYLQKTPESILTEYRSVGRKKLPSSVIGILFHAAEHLQRHVGQLLVTASVVRGDTNELE